jgi:hypothetical protein
MTQVTGVTPTVLATPLTERGEHAEHPYHVTTSTRDGSPV